VARKHINLMRAILHDPVCGNIQWQEIESLVASSGCQDHACVWCAFPLKLSDFDAFLHHPHQGNV
jgi:hypothetical protein